MAGKRAWWRPEILHSNEHATTLSSKTVQNEKSSNTITKAIKVKSAFGPSGPSGRRLSPVSVA